MEVSWLVIGELAGHVEGLDEVAKVLGHEALGEHLPDGLPLVAHHARPLVNDLALLLVLLLHLREIPSIVNPSYIYIDILISRQRRRKLPALWSIGSIEPQ